MTRIACLFIPLFPLAARLRSEPELAGEAVAVCEGNGSAARVVGASRPARRSGVRSGMSLAQARGILPSLIARGRDVSSRVRPTRPSSRPPPASRHGSRTPPRTSSLPMSAGWNVSTTALAYEHDMGQAAIIAAEVPRPADPGRHRQQQAGRPHRRPHVRLAKGGAGR